MSSEEAAARELEAIKALEITFQSTIMKIMKSNRTLKHTELANKVEENLQKSKKGSNFSKRAMKIAIEGLIQKGYLERDHSDYNTYIHKA
ncbi:hypothetical protein STCU_11654 [Strigomonas culicis]|uniref:Cullin neddylation domain-containing protein n=1 Tax=Strigomonas culicis TaxID=28005 RepID=S9TD42_9TRYP|nr:hypothetical protein STCU_11654 [Strigomonas culicis]|eukprot:EPY15947.1 hypothetical protein STCU_11654 [Strigomonas culicis]